jgi:hypothetical protein
VSNVFFWIIILSFLIPFAMRMYRKSVRGRNQNQDFNGQYPGQFPGQFPGQQPGRPSNQPRDGYTQQDYFGGGFRQLGGQQQPPLDPPYQNPGYPAAGYQNPGYQYPGYPAVPGGPGQVPYEDSPEYPGNQSRQAAQQQPTAPATPPLPSAPQGFRARKLAELDQQYSNGEIAMEEYMTRRNEIMNG